MEISSVNSQLDPHHKDLAGPLSTEERASFHPEIYQWLQSLIAQVSASYLKNKDMQTSHGLKHEAGRWVEVGAVFFLDPAKTP